MITTTASINTYLGGPQICKWTDITNTSRTYLGICTEIGLEAEAINDGDIGRCQEERGARLGCILFQVATTTLKDLRKGRDTISGTLDLHLQNK